MEADAAAARAGENYMLAGADAGYAELVGVLGEIMQRKLSTLILPKRLFKRLGRILGLVSRFTGWEPFVTLEGTAYLSANLISRPDKAIGELGHRAVSLLFPHLPVTNTGVSRFAG